MTSPSPAGYKQPVEIQFGKQGACRQIRVVWMAVKIIAIDTSHGKDYSCTAFGFENGIVELHEEFSNAMYGRKGQILHYSKTSSKIRQKAQRKIFGAIQNTSVQFYIFEHKKPQGEERKNYYLTYIPNNITAFISTRLIGKYGIVIVEAGRDFEVSGVKDGTTKFIRNFLFQMCFKLAGKPVTIRHGDEMRATVKFPNQNRLSFIGRQNTHYNSKAIQLADVVLGYWLNSRHGMGKIFYRKL